jgi:hypothetical protein
VSDLRAGFIAQYDGHDIEAQGAILDVVRCKEVAGRAVHSRFLVIRDGRFGWPELLVRAGFDLDENERSVGIDHDQIKLAGFAKEIARDCFEAFAFEKSLATFLAPPAEPPLIRQQPTLGRQEFSYIESHSFGRDEHTSHNEREQGHSSIETGITPWLPGYRVVAVSLGQSDGLAGPLPEEIEFGPAFFAAANRLNVQDVRRMQREDSFDAFVVDDSPDREALVNAPPFAGNDRPGEDLGSLLVALFDQAVHVYDVADLEVRDITLETLAFNRV